MTKRILLLLIFIFKISLFNNIFAYAEGPKNYLKGKFYNSVKNHFLIATKKMNDNKLKKTVIVMLESDENGAWGLVINKPLGSIPIALLIDSSFNTPDKREKLYKIKIPIFWGGPVEEKQIYILHSEEYENETTKNYKGISITRDYKILFDIAENKGPQRYLIILGYSGWADGQLEGEMEVDHWILSELDSQIVFEEESKNKWPQAYENSFIRL